MNLWDIAIEKSKDKNGASENVESTILFIGNKQSGKTSIIQKFLDRDEIPKSTVALEYTFGRRARGHGSSKDVVHLWELGGGTWLTKLIDSTITLDNILSSSVVLVLDLSRPNELWYTYECLMKAIKSRVETIIERSESQKSTNLNIREKLKENMREYLQDVPQSPDQDMIERFPLPLVIIGSKYDVLIDQFDATKQKMILKTLRFLAHYNGASLICCSTKQDQSASMNKARSVISHLAFSTNDPKTQQFEFNRPLIIPVGADSLESIGSPPSNDEDFNRMSARTPLDLWKNGYCSVFEQEKEALVPLLDDPARDSQYVEPIIDNARKQKDEELDRFKKVSDRKMRDLMQQTVNEGIMIV